MFSTPESVEPDMDVRADDGKGTIRVIVADTQAIFRAGLRKVFALEDDIRVVGQAENVGQAMMAIQKFSADVMVLEAALGADPAEMVSDLMRQSGSCRLVVVLQAPDQETTLELFRRGAHAVVSKEVEPEMLVNCLRQVARGEPWLDPQAVAWVLDAYRTQGTRPAASRPKVQLTPKESLIVSCVTPGDEKQGDCVARRHHRTGGEKLSTQGLRQARCCRPPGVGPALPESTPGR